MFSLFTGLVSQAADYVPDVTAYLKDLGVGENDKLQTLLSVGKSQAAGATEFTIYRVTHGSRVTIVFYSGIVNDAIEGDYRSTDNILETFAARFCAIADDLAHGKPRPDAVSKEVWLFYENKKVALALIFNGFAGSLGDTISARANKRPAAQRAP